MFDHINARLGFMQGRLSPKIDGRIQAFPVKYWEREFRFAKIPKLKYMEWTLDRGGIFKNPFLTKKGQNKILQLSQTYQLKVNTLTGDFLMQQPFFKFGKSGFEKEIKVLKNVIEASSIIGVRYIVMPLVDNGSIKTFREIKKLILGMERLYEALEKHKINILFESDFPPKKLADFCDNFDPNLIGINYDIGNSASLGYDWRDELEAYGPLIKNVHIKDRKLNGTTVPLGCGNADIQGVIVGLEQANYQGLYILQTARAQNGRHISCLIQYQQYLSSLFNGSN